MSASIISTRGSHRESKNPSTQQVFLVPELLGQILLNLPVIDLVNLQSVNSTWQDIVKQPRFQKKLFFTAKVPKRIDRSGPLHWNPVLELAGAELDGENCYVLCKELYGRFLVKEDTPKERRQLRNGSWQQTRITQPPSKELVVSICGGKNGRVPIASVHTLDNPDGVHLQQLCRHMNKILAPACGLDEDDERPVGPDTGCLMICI